MYGMTIIPKTTPKKKKGRGPTKIKKKNEKLKAFFFSCQGLIFFFYDCWALRLGNVFLKNN
jgi:hypothetical protein